MTNVRELSEKTIAVIQPCGVGDPDQSGESEVAQSCLTLCDPMDCSPPGSSIHDFPGKSTGVGCYCLL